jgi:beta-glucosidase
LVACHGDDNGGDDGAIASAGFCGDAREEVDGRVEALLAQMTLAEKVEQMHGAGAISGGWLTPANERLGIPGFAMIDGPRGVSALAGNATAFPVGMARGATWDPDLEERVGEAIGGEARAKGASVLLAPTINLLRHPSWGRAQETYGEDPLHLGKMGAAFIRGVQRHVVANAKHYALNSIEDTRFSVSVSVDERALREVYLPHFRMAVDEGHVASVMTAYNRVRGEYAAENQHLLRDILKGEWAFDGFVESDWVLGTRSTVASALAGLDIEMPADLYFGAPLLAAAESGEVPQDVIDAAVRRVLRVKLCFRLDSDPPVPDPAAVGTADTLALARAVERAAIVLLRNEEAALPLDAEAIGSLAVIGPLADAENLGDTGSSAVSPTEVITPLEAIVERLGAAAVVHVPDLPFGDEEADAIAAADAAVVVVGLSAEDEGEGAVGAGDRPSLALPRGQADLIRAVAALNPRAVVVLEGGSAITVEDWYAQVPAILMAWYPGQEGGAAIADVLFGDADPSGRLPLTFARAESDLPVFDNTSLEVTYDYYHGYRYLDRTDREPRYPFGFGLGYTAFAYDDLRLADATVRAGEDVRVEFLLTNIGDRAGDEVAQLYVSYQGSRVDRAARDLKAFAKVHLEAGETRRVTLTVPADSLAFYDADAASWELEPITYAVHVGSSSRDLPLTATFRVVGGI